MISTQNQSLLLRTTFSDYDPFSESASDRSRSQVCPSSPPFSDTLGLLKTGCADEKVDLTTASSAYAWILPYPSTASPAFCTPHLVPPPRFFHGSYSFGQPSCPLMFAYLTARCTHVIRLRAPDFRMMTWRIFSSARGMDTAGCQDHL